VYQEDIIKFLQEVCGLSGSEADTVRRGIAKKKMSILDEMMPRILEGYCSKSDKPREQSEAEAHEFIKIIEDASSYMFG
jgi:DNA polymerase III alpha subunit